MKVRQDFIYDPGLVLYLPLYELDGASFESRDSNGHLCTVTGALWGPDGRLFDGVDDLVEVNSIATTINFGVAHTILTWAKIGNWTGAAKCLVGPGRTDAVRYETIQYETGNKKFHAAISVAGGTNKVSSAGTYENDSDWHFFALVVNDAGHITNFIIDDTDEGSDTTNLDLSVFNKFYIGQLVYTSANTNEWFGTIGEVSVYSGGLSLLEIQRYRLATKWRYR